VLVEIPNFPPAGQFIGVIPKTAEKEFDKLSDLDNT
jgi:hypothetical protein